jgi:hypothetical protein
MAQDLYSLLVSKHLHPFINLGWVVKLEPLDHPNQRLHMIKFYEAHLTQPHA